MKYNQNYFTAMQHDTSACVISSKRFTLVMNDIKTSGIYKF